jgi:hypothetical protein
LKAAEANVDARLYTVNYRTLDKERQVKVEDIVPDEEVAAHIEVFDQSPKTSQRARFVEMEPARHSVATQQTVASHASILFYEDTDGQQTSALGVE